MESDQLTGRIERKDFHCAPASRVYRGIILNQIFTMRPHFGTVTRHSSEKRNIN